MSWVCSTCLSVTVPAFNISVYPASKYRTLKITSLTKSVTLLYRLCTNDNIPGAKLKDAVNTLTLSGYNLSTDTFLKMESHLAVAKLKEDDSFYKYLMTKMTRPVSLLLQCRRAVVKVLGDPYRNKVKMLSDIAVPNLIIDFLNFSDL